MAIESSTFSPHRAGERDFAVATGAELLNRYDAIREGALGTAAEWIPVHYARSIPGGAVLREVYEGHKAAILAGLTEAVAAGPLDGLFFDIHGAMSVDGLDDAEGDLIRSVREVIGQDTLVSASMDLHGNVSRDLIENVNLITCYRLAPHEDTWETRDPRTDQPRQRTRSAKPRPAHRLGARADPAPRRKDQHPRGARQEPLPSHRRD